MARWLLLIAGVLTSAIAVLHVVVIFVGAPGYRYFGAGERIAQQAERGSSLPALVTLLIAAVFAVFSLYAFSGSGIVRRLPLLRVGLLGIGTVFVLRGLAVFHQLMQLSQQGRPLLHRAIVFSAVSLLDGTSYLLGVLLSWKALGSRSE